MSLDSYEAEQLENIKRNVRHGLSNAEKSAPEFIDLFLHIQNIIGEIEAHNHTGEI